jgi:hypothetical protein
MLRDIRFLLKSRYSNSRALLIGINEYAHASPLSYAVNDAEEFCSALIKDLTFPPEHVTLLTNTQATKQGILGAFLRFAKSDVDIDERIVVFFAGHGHTQTGFRGEIGYLVPFDGDTTRLETLIRWDDLTKSAELVRAKHLLFIMDACYGGLALTRNVAPGSARFLKDMLLRYSRQVLAAGKADEIVSDSGGPLPGHSVFTGHLLEGIRGKARTEDGILTANGLMAYVYGKVARDRESRQSPHYGYIDGDGDLILQAPQLGEDEEDDEKDLDTLLVVPYGDEESPEDSTQTKLKTVKSLLSTESSSIELHDFVVDEVRRFLAATSEDHFELNAPYSNEDLIDRIGRYEVSVKDLALIMACIAYWARPTHRTILAKAYAASTDSREAASGRTILINLRWYPIIIELYCAGIAAVAGRRYDSLANMFFTSVVSSTGQSDRSALVEAVAEMILNLNRDNVFKQLPGYERHYTPLSDYLLKILQPGLDDLLFLGKGYERAFDEFEVLLALVTADVRTQRGATVWGPVGRFSWKQRLGNEGPLARVLFEAETAGELWEPTRAGLFGGSIERAKEIAREYAELVSGLNR